MLLLGCRVNVQVMSSCSSFRLSSVIGFVVVCRLLFAWLSIVLVLVVFNEECRSSLPRSSSACDDYVM